MKKDIPAEANEVIKKYGRKPFEDTKGISILSGIMTTGGLVAGAALDMAFLAGFGTVLLTTAGTMGALPSLAYAYYRAQIKMGKYENSAGQNIKANYDTICALIGMQRYLSEKYDAARKAYIEPEQQREFLSAVEEVNTDLKKLSPQFKIAANQRHPKEDQEIKFILNYTFDSKTIGSISVDKAVEKTKLMLRLYGKQPEKAATKEPSPPSPPKQKLKLTW